MKKFIFWGLIIGGYVILSAINDSPVKNNNVQSESVDIQSHSYINNVPASTAVDYSDNNLGDVTEEDKEPISGSHNVEACNSRTGSCYDLDAEVEDGQVTQIDFPNGGHLDMDGAELDENFEATGDSYTNSEGYNGDQWDITCNDCE